MRTRRSYRLKGAFPAYAQQCRHLVTPQRLQQAVQRATGHFIAQRAECERVFRQHACRKFHCKPSAVQFTPLHESLRRIRSAVLVPGDDFYGWTDGVTIHVSHDLPMAFDELVGTLIHEELHCFCKARGNFLGADRDHHCMRVLGDEC